MAAPAFRTGTNIAGGNATAANVGTLTLDADALSGDIVVFLLYKENTAAATPGGTAVGTWFTFSQNSDGAPSFQCMVAVGRVTTAGGTITCTWTGSTYLQWAYIGASGGVAAGDPNDVTPTGVADSTSGTTADTPAITTITDECLIVRMIGTFGAQPFTPPTGYAERIDTASFNEVSIADLAQAVAGVSAATTFGQTSSGESVGITVAIRPVAAAAAALQPRPTILRQAVQVASLR